MIRRLLLLTAGLAVLITEPAWAVGLGKLELKSALNQEFHAEIEITSLGGLTREELLPNLASQADFDRVGVDRNYQLADLRFSIATNDNSDLVVLIKSQRPVVEPFLNFLVELIWPNGRILREYTVLLDPPVFGDAGVQPIAPASNAQQPGTASRQQGTDSSQAGSTGRVSVPGSGRQTTRPRTGEGEVVEDEYGVTGPGDTLWKIALKVRPDRSVTVQQTMLAIQRANPEAFIDNNINLLKAGYVLRIPSKLDITEESVASAVEQVKAQNDRFENYRSGSLAQMDATPRQPERRRQAPRQPEGELKLLASESTSGSRAGDTSERTEELEESLAIAREDLDRARRTSSEMNTRLSDLEEQIETMSEIVKLKDSQLAELRAQLQKAQDAARAAASQAPAPAPTPEPTSASPLAMLSNPFVLGGVGLLLVLAVAGGLILMRRRKSADGDDDLPGLQLADDAAEAPVADDDLPALQTEVEADDDGDGSSLDDVISEAEIYIAYGRFPQAISFLSEAIAKSPSSAELQLKLLEVYVQTEDAIAFNLQYEQLQSLGDDAANAQAAELQKQIPGAAETQAASMDATVVSSEPIAPVSEAGGDMDFDLDSDDDISLDDMDLGLDDDDDGGLDLDLDDEGGDDEIDLGLDDDDAGDEIDLELDADSEDDEIELDMDSDDDISLDLDDDVDLGLDADDDEISLDTDDDEIDLDSGDDDLELDLGDDDEVDLSGDDGDELDLGDADDELDLGGDDLELDTDDDIDLGGDDELDLDDDDGIELDLGDDDDDGLDLSDADDELDLDSSDELDLGDDDDAIELDLGDDDDDALDLSDSADDELDLGDDDAFDLSDADDDMNLDDLDDDALELDLDAGDDDSLDQELQAAADDLGNDDLELDLGDDDEISLDFGDDDDEISLDLDDDDDLGDLNLDEDASSKLDLARAYIDMGDNDGAKELLNEVIKEGTDDDIQEANQLMEKIG